MTTIKGHGQAFYPIAVPDPILMCMSIQVLWFAHVWRLNEAAYRRDCLHSTVVSTVTWDVKRRALSSRLIIVPLAYNLWNEIV